jgi:hypothetical protein
MSADINSSESRKDKAKAAADKKAIMGEDIDLTKFTRAAEDHPYQKDPSQLASATKSKMLEAGLMLDDPSQRVGTFIQMDNTPIHSSVKEEGVEVMPVSQAMKTYDWLSDYYWKAVAVDTDKYTASVEMGQNDGYFIRTLPGVKTDFPVQACLYLSKAKFAQNVHNIIIAEENSELHIITGCTTSLGNEPGMHLGVSEFYIKKGA